MTILTKTLLITSITLIICIESANCHPPDSCRCDTITPTIEHGYGPPHPPIFLEDNTEKNYQEYLKYLDENDKNSDYLYELGYLAYEMKDLDRAIEYFELSERYNNYTVLYYNTYLHNWLGDIWEQKGDLEKAQECYLKRGDIYYIRLIQAKIHEQNGELWLAEQEYQKASQVQLFEALSADPLKLAAEMYLRAGKVDTVENVIEMYFKQAIYYATKYVCELEVTAADWSLSGLVEVSQDDINEGWAFIREIKRQRKEKLGY